MIEFSTHFHSTQNPKVNQEVAGKSRIDSVYLMGNLKQALVLSFEFMLLIENFPFLH